MKEINAIAMKNMEVRSCSRPSENSSHSPHPLSLQNDTQLVSILYRTHKTLSASCKIHSLYVFDSLSRAAKHQVDKQGLTGNLTSERGNCATFLLKVDGVLDGLFQDMAVSGSEAKVSSPESISY